MRVDVVTLFPEMFEGFLSCGLPRIAQEKELLEVRLTNFRDFASDRRGTVDDRPFGGGAGMVLMCEPVIRAVESIESAAGDSRGRRLLLSPQGCRLDQALIEELSQEAWLLLICGHYEGFDERIRLALNPLEVSVGDYVLSGGELPAMTLIDAVTRLIPGAVGDPESVRDDSFSNELRGLEYPQYTRPRVFREMAVPEVLLNGNHQRIAQWRREQGIARTRERRPDLLTEDQKNQPE